MTDTTRPGDITRNLHSWADGDKAAQEELYRLTERRIRAIAATIVRETWNPSGAGTDTMLQEGVLRLLKTSPIRFQNRRHFYNAFARAVRFSLSNHSRSQRIRLVGQGGTPLDPEAHEVGDVTPPIMLALAEAFESLKNIHGDDFVAICLGHMIGGESLPELAARYEVSERTARGYVGRGRALLRIRLTGLSE